MGGRDPLYPEWTGLEETPFKDGHSPHMSATPRTRCGASGEGPDF